MRTIVVLAIALLLVGCASMGYSDPRTAADHQWYEGFVAAQDAGGTCTDKSCRYRDFLHEEVGVPYEKMRFVSSRDSRFGTYHWRLQVHLGVGWRTFDPQMNAFNFTEGQYECPYRRQVTRRVYQGDARPVETGGVYHRETNPTE